MLARISQIQQSVFLYLHLFKVPHLLMLSVLLTPDTCDYDIPSARSSGSHKHAFVQPSDIQIPFIILKLDFVEGKTSRTKIFLFSMCEFKQPRPSVIGFHVGIHVE